MITAIIDAGQKYCHAVSDLWQWDYGQTLRIQGVALPAAVEVQFSVTERAGETITRIGVTKDGVTDVPIPDALLEGGTTSQDYTIYAFVYIEDGDSGKTEHRISMKVWARPKPQPFEAPDGSEEAGLFQQAITAVNESADRAENAAESANSAKTASEAARNAAVMASGTAVTAATSAETFKNDAENARNEAVQAASDAANSKESAEETVKKVYNDLENIVTLIITDYCQALIEQVKQNTEDIEYLKNKIEKESSNIAIEKSDFEAGSINSGNGTNTTDSICVRTKNRYTFSKKVIITNANPSLYRVKFFIYDLNGKFVQADNDWHTEASFDFVADSNYSYRFQIATRDGSAIDITDAVDSVLFYFEQSE